MTRKSRGYKRAELARPRDYKLFALAVEGRKTEYGYFKLLELSSRIKIDIIGHPDEEEELGSANVMDSAPKYLLDRAVEYVERMGLIDSDELWFVLDTDRWTREQLNQLYQACADRSNWHIAVSNPCFEVWLYYHLKNVKPDPSWVEARDFKRKLPDLISGGYDATQFIKLIREALVNARNNDSNLGHYLPMLGETKVHLLAEALLKHIPALELAKAGI